MQNWLGSHGYCWISFTWESWTKQICKKSHCKSQSYTWQRETISKSEFCLCMFGPSQRKDITGCRTARSLLCACFLQDIKTPLLLWFIAQEYLLPVLLGGYHSVSLGIIRVAVKKTCIRQVSHHGEFRGIREEAEDPWWRSLSLSDTWMSFCISTSHLSAWSFNFSVGVPGILSAFPKYFLSS